ncbi:hypothetical protein ACOMHN_007124 [Nucella lapillus]
MACTGAVQEILMQVKLVLVLCILVTSSLAWTHSGGDRSPLVHTVAKKRGNMDLVFIQMYQLCDRDRNGLFSAVEFHCLNDMLRLLIGVRRK